jgi:PAP2 superfamily
MKLLVPAFLISTSVLAAAPLSAQTIAPAATSSSDETMPAFGSLFTDLPGDFVHLLRQESAIILGAGGGLSAAVHSRDTQLTQDAVGAHGLEHTLDPGQFIGDSYAQAGGALATYLVGRLSHNARVATIGAELVRAQIVNEVLTGGLKVAVGRRRPDGGTQSFPSGHTSATFATAAVLQRELGWKVGAAAYALASYVAISRLSENKHYASDLAFGAAIGIVAGRSVTLHHGKHNLALTPLAAPGGAGVGVSWTPAR